MALLREFSTAQITDLRTRVAEVVRSCTHLRDAAQKSAGVVFQQFQGSAVLVRWYVVLPAKVLAPAYHSFAVGVAKSRGVAAPLQEQTPVLALLGTRGVEPAWNDPLQSANHLAIPLAGSSFVEEIPMVARLMHDMGVGLNWLDTTDDNLFIKNLGNIAGVFYVEDARSDCDDRGRRIVPAEAFVAAHDVRTVFGLGGSYRAGVFVAAIVFCQETLSRTQVQFFMPLVTTFKRATVRLVNEGRYFA